MVRLTLVTVPPYRIVAGNPLLVPATQVLAGRTERISRKDLLTCGKRVSFREVREFAMEKDEEQDPINRVARRAMEPSGFRASRRAGAVVHH